MSLSEQRDAAVEKIRQELRRLVLLSEQTQRSIEEKNGYTRGYLSQVLQGHITLTAEHVFAVLLALELSPAQFFWQVLQTPADQPETYAGMMEIRQRLARYDAALKELETKGVLGPPAVKDDRDRK
jgi:transcriptional regulator with XRE-family HTH domain